MIFSKPRLIAVDMDGTLLRSDGTVSPASLSALQAAHAAGVEVVIATGRRHSFAMQPLRELDLPTQNALISSNGTVIRTIGAELMYRAHMPAEVARWLVHHTSHFRSSMVFTFDTVQPDGTDSVGALVAEHQHDLDDNVGRWMEANRPFFSNVERLEEVFDIPASELSTTGVSPADPQALARSSRDPIQAMLCGSVDRMDEAMARLLESDRVTLWEGAATTEDADITLHRTEYRERDLIIIDILPAGCSKASALERLVALRGLQMDQVLAIGDNWNDLPMLEATGQAVLMSNAPEPLQKMAQKRGWPIAPTNDDDGVAWSIEQALSAPVTEPK